MYGRCQKPISKSWLALQCHYISYTICTSRPSLNAVNPRFLISDLLVALLLCLGHSDVEDAVLKLGLDLVLVDNARKDAAARELAVGPLAHPVPGRRPRGCLRLASLAAGLSSLLPTAIPALDHPGHLRRLKQTSVALGVAALSAAAHHEGLLVGELNPDVLGRHAGQLGRPRTSSQPPP